MAEMKDVEIKVISSLSKDEMDFVVQLIDRLNKKPDSFNSDSSLDYAKKFLEIYLLKAATINIKDGNE